MAPGSKIHDTADHLSVRIARNFSSTGRARVGADIRIGINVQNIKDAVPESDIKPGIITAADSFICVDACTL